LPQLFEYHQKTFPHAEQMVLGAAFSVEGLVGLPCHRIKRFVEEVIKKYQEKVRKSLCF
jgi:hypothetical protein